MALLLIGLLEGSVQAQPSTWTLWEVTERTETRRAGTAYETNPTGHVAVPLDRDVDRARCEFLKNLRIQNRFRSDEHARAIPDGAVVHVTSGSVTEMIATRYVCLERGVKPPNFPRTGIRAPGPPQNGGMDTQGSGATK
jgi:hypothetical protein